MNENTKNVMTITLIVVSTLMLLQSYLFICGCSNPADTGTSTVQTGRWLYSANCGSCHGLLAPEEYPIGTWEHYVDKYGKQMSDQEKQQVLNYLGAKP
jgi:mono/diheme cytochrome c family protein